MSQSLNYFDDGEKGVQAELVSPNMFLEKSKDAFKPGEP